MREEARPRTTKEEIVSRGSSRKKRKLVVEPVLKGG